MKPISQLRLNILVYPTHCPFLGSELRTSFQVPVTRIPPARHVTQQVLTGGNPNSSSALSFRDTKSFIRPKPRTSTKAFTLTHNSHTAFKHPVEHRLDNSARLPHLATRVSTLSLHGKILLTRSPVIHTIKPYNACGHA